MRRERPEKTPVYGHALAKFRQTCNSQLHARFGLTLRGSRFLVTVGLGLGEHQAIRALLRKRTSCQKGGSQTCKDAILDCTPRMSIVDQFLIVSERIRPNSKPRPPKPSASLLSLQSWVHLPPERANPNYPSMSLNDINSGEPLGLFWGVVGKPMINRGRRNIKHGFASCRRLFRSSCADLTLCSWKTPSSRA